MKHLQCLDVFSVINNELLFKLKKYILLFIGWLHCVLLCHILFG